MSDDDAILDLFQRSLHVLRDASIAASALAEIDRGDDAADWRALRRLTGETGGEAAEILRGVREMLPEAIQIARRAGMDPGPLLEIGHDEHAPRPLPPLITSAEGIAMGLNRYNRPPDATEFNAALRRVVELREVLRAKPDRKPGMTWQAAKKKAESHCARNAFPGNNALAEVVGCSPATMHKAINLSEKLRKKAVEYQADRKAQPAMSISEKLAESAEQTRELDPVEAAAAATDTLFQRLVEQATPEQRAKLHAMTPTQRRELVVLDREQQADQKADTVRKRSRHRKLP